MKNTTAIFLIVIMLLGAGSFVFSSISPGSASVTGEAVNIQKGELQKVTLSMKELNYYPQTIKVKAGKPVELTLDGSVKGCLRSFTSRELGISKYARTPDEKIIFTPTKKGIFAFSCSMGMGSGKLIVE